MRLLRRRAASAGDARLAVEMHDTVDQPSGNQWRKAENCSGRVAAWVGDGPCDANAFAVQLGHAVGPSVDTKVGAEVDNLRVELEQFGANCL